MDKEGWFSILVAVALAIAVVALYRFGAVWLPTPKVMFASDTSENALSQLGAIADAVDHMVSMLFSVTVGLFALVGLALRGGLPAGRARWWLSLIFFMLFGATSLASLYLAFRERLEVVHAATLPSASLSDIDDLLGQHALYVALSAIFAIYLGVDGLLRSAKASGGNGAAGGGP